MFTSNTHSREILEELATRSALGNLSVQDEVCRRRLHAAGMAPELAGRIGRFLVYQPLSPEVRAEILTLAVAEVAEEYGLGVDAIAPQVIVDLMGATNTQDFGVRPERYMIDDVLGGCFAAAAAQGVSERVEVVGPPYVCRVLRAREKREGEEGD